MGGAIECPVYTEIASQQFAEAAALVDGVCEEVSVWQTLCQPYCWSDSQQFFCVVLKGKKEAHGM